MRPQALLFPGLLCLRFEPGDLLVEPIKVMPPLRVAGRGCDKRRQDGAARAQLGQGVRDVTHLLIDGRKAAVADCQIVLPAGVAAACGD